MTKPCMRNPLLITSSLLIVQIIQKAQIPSFCGLRSLHYADSDFFPPTPPRVPFHFVLIHLSEFKNHGIFTSSVAIWDAYVLVGVIKFWNLVTETFLKNLVRDFSFFTEQCPQSKLNFVLTYSLDFDSIPLQRNTDYQVL